MNFHQFSQQKIYKTKQENEFPPVFPTKTLKQKTRAWTATSFPNNNSEKKQTREWISTSFPNKNSETKNKRMNFHQFSQQKIYKTNKRMNFHQFSQQ